MQVGLGAAPRVRYPEGKERLSRRGRDVHAPRIAVLTFRRHDALKRMGEGQVHVHVVFAAHHLQGLDRRHSFRPIQRPYVPCSTGHSDDLEKTRGCRKYAEYADGIVWANLHGCELARVGTLRLQIDGRICVLGVHSKIVTFCRFLLNLPLYIAIIL